MCVEVVVNGITYQEEEISGKGKCLVPVSILGEFFIAKDGYNIWMARQFVSDYPNPRLASKFSLVLIRANGSPLNQDKVVDGAHICVFNNESDLLRWIVARGYKQIPNPFKS